jgi:hypothetical protein
MRGILEAVSDEEDNREFGCFVCRDLHSH